MVTMGAILAGSKAEEYYYNAFFRVKIVLLLCVALHGLVFRRLYADTVGLGPDQGDSGPGEGCGSLFLCSVERLGDRGAWHRLHRASAGQASRARRAGNFVLLDD